MSHKFEATVDGIKIHYDGGEVEVDYDVSDGDVVRLTIEPLEVKVTDGFRAAVKKACNCDSSSGGGSGGSTGGGVLVVHINKVTGAFDKTWQEIYDADFAVLKMPSLGNNAVTLANVSAVDTYEGDYTAVFVRIDETEDGVSTTTYIGVTDSPDGYPVLEGSGGGFTPGESM